MRRKVKDYLKKSILVLVSIFLSLVIAEGASRIIFDPIDYLKPERVPDNILGFKILPNTGAHDSWGYRNKSVPSTADIVTIGDSNTYGISATASNSWPSILGQSTGKVVYNISLGGYGPVEYFYLLKNKAFKLNPSLVIVGFYFGNDLENAYNSVYKNEYWRHLRRSDFVPKEIINEDEMVRHGLINRILDWPPAHSVSYRIISSSFLGDEVRQLRRIYRGEEIIMFKNKENNIRTGFMPSMRLKVLNLDDSTVKEGLRISLELFSRMNELSKKRKIDFLVLLIPTKENVFSEYIEHNGELPSSNIIDKLISNERRVNELVKSYFTEHSIAFIDVEDALRNAARSEQLYPNNFGGHLNKNGYRIVAGAIERYLSKNNKVCCNSN
jgi:lysophospholipase L1-like esterase